MTEKEKKAIDILKDFTENEDTAYCYDWNGFDYETILSAIECLLNLIEKQQNKIASQEKQIKLMQSCDLAKVIKEQEEEIEELKKPKFIINAETGEVTKIHNDFISKDKIRDKIKELESHIWKDGYMTKFDEYAIHYLEELLEE